MEIIRTIAWMKEHARQARAAGRIIGFVPTMGALHQGHVSLIDQARQNCSPAIVSIFVNPKQFGPNEDFTKYPRDFEKDVQTLTSARVDTLFAPEAKEMYSNDFRTYINVDGLSERLEGRSRPGHFRGVATAVLKLLQIVHPHFAYFGRKDAQQARIITQMTRDLNVDTEIVVGPIVREPDGLALSSRNTYLNAEERRAATVLYRALDRARSELAHGARDALRLQTAMRSVIETEPLAKVDYVEIADAETFQPVTQVSRACYALLAVFIGKTRLIDNLYVAPAPGHIGDLLFHL